MRAISNIAYSAFVVTSLLVPHSLHAKADAPAALIEKDLGGRILDAKPGALEKAIADGIHEDRKQSDKFAATILKSGRADANSIAPFLVVASIQALGKEIKEGELTALIYETTRVTPDAVLEIVGAASREVPQNLVPVIVSAAIRAVPDPYKTVEYRKGNSKKSEGHKDSSKDSSESGVAETLAEAIIDAATNASGVDRAVIVAAANLELDSHLGANIHAPSAQGEGGPSDPGNEPRVLAPTIPVVSK